MSADFNKIADYYDDMYVNQESYQKETDEVDRIIQNYSKTHGNTLLDIACGTGEQAYYLSSRYEVTGIDLSEEMLKIARTKVPGARFVKEDMFDFNLNQKFDAIINLYGSIGFAMSTEQLREGLKCAYNHLKTNGVFILTPWCIKETFQESIVSKCKNLDNVSYCRMESIKRISDDKVQVEMYHLIGKRIEIKQFHHIQIITLFSEDEYISSIESVGFKLLKCLDSSEFRMGAFICSK
jgi:ubiquinone/menaquinone biosynthesis C-methylase UbiE